MSQRNEFPDQVAWMKSGVTVRGNGELGLFVSVRVAAVVPGMHRCLHRSGVVSKPVAVSPAAPLGVVAGRTSTQALSDADVLPKPNN